MTWWEALAWLPTAIWVYLVTARGRFWLPTVHLPDPSEPEVWPAVAIVVPARNEEEMLTRTLPGLLAQEYPGVAEVVVVDDRSTDRTLEVAEAAGAGGLLHLRVRRGTERPPGWVGKTWALEQGYQAARSATPEPEFVLFTDADIEHPRHSLRQMVAAATGGSKDLVSQMARLRADTGWERQIIPAFVYLFSQLYPFRLANRDGSRTAAAAGGCVLVKVAALERAGGVEAIAGAVIDDVALGRAVKRSGGSIWLGYATEVESVRPYPRLSDLWDMVARSAYTQLGYSPLALIGTVAGLVVTYLGWLIVLTAGLLAGNGTLIWAGAMAWVLLTASYLPMVSYYRLNPLYAATLPFAAVMYGAMTVDSARRHRRGAGAAWKGRTYAPTGV